MNIQSTVVKEDLHRRLRRIEGQARGVQRMLDDDRDCREIIQQMKAIQSAMRNASAVFMRSYAKECLVQTDHPVDRERLVDEIVDIMA